MSKHMTLLAGMVVSVALFPMIEGCCMPATSNPIAAATAGAKILGAVQGLQDAETDEEVAAAVLEVAETVSNLTTSEIASAVNMIGELDWSLEDAENIKELASQVDQDLIDNITDLGDDFSLDDPNVSAEDVADILTDAGMTISESQAEILTDAYEQLKDLDPNTIMSSFGF